MKVVSYREPGGVEVLEYADVPDPEPGAIDVVVRVEACALNRLDAIQRHGWYQLPGFTSPHIAGMDVAGDVVAIGDAVTTVAAGARVVINPALNCGTCGECVSGNDASQNVHVPDGVRSAATLRPACSKA